MTEADIDEAVHIVAQMGKNLTSKRWKKVPTLFWAVAVMTLHSCRTAYLQGV